MESLKKLYFANWWFFVITLVLYLTIWLGAFLHMLFGVFQITTFFYLLYIHKKLTQKVKIQLLIYFVFTLITCVVPIMFKNEYAIYAWLATWILALYLISILYQIIKTKS